MKIRTDFVTNSSSSSFIYKEYNKEDVKKAIEERLSISPRGEWEAKDYEWIREWGNYVEGERFHEQRLWDLYEVYQWYEDEVLANIVEIEKNRDYREQESWEEGFKRVINEEHFWEKLSEEKKRRLAAKFVLDIYLGKYWYNYNWASNEEGKILVEKEFLQAEIWDYMGSQNRKYDILVEFYIDHVEELLKQAEQFEGMLVADVMEIFFDAQYLYFNQIETHYLICEALENAGLCLYSCGHMG